MLLFSEGLGRVESFFKPIAHECLLAVAVADLLDVGHVSVCMYKIID